MEYCVIRKTKLPLFLGEKFPTWKWEIAHVKDTVAAFVTLQLSEIFHVESFPVERYSAAKNIFNEKCQFQ